MVVDVFSEFSEAVMLYGINLFNLFIFLNSEILSKKVLEH